MQSYLSKIIQQVKNCFVIDEESMQFELHCENLKLFNDKAIIIGLILNELISNTFKHVLPTVPKAHISISLSFTNEQFLFIYSDNGAEKIDVELLAGNGLALVQGLSDQLSGKSKFGYKNGCYFQLKFA